MHFNIHLSHNKLSSSILNHKIPYKILYNHPPHYNHLKIFNYLYYITTSKKNKNKFQTKINPYIFLNTPLKKKHILFIILILTKFFITKTLLFIKLYFLFLILPFPNNLTIFLYLLHKILRFILYFLLLKYPLQLNLPHLPLKHILHLLFPLLNP